MAYYLYVYSPSDFVVTPPDEVGAQAGGSPTFTLTLKAGATPTLIEVSDDDSVFDEVDGSQTLTSGINLDGTAYGAGTTVHTAYDLINTTTGHKITSLHFGGDGYEQGAVDGIVSTVEMVPGTSYTFNVERTSHTQNNQYDDYYACFAKGCLIETDQGQVPVEMLSVGDLVKTQDRGYQPIRWISGRKLRAVGKVAPIVFAKGAIGNTDELIVSPEHRVLIEGARVELLFGCNQVLVAAKFLCDGDRIYRKSGGEVTYYHFMFDQHEIIYSQGVPTESFLSGDAAMAGLSAGSQAEIYDVFPELRQQTNTYEAATLCLKSYEVGLLADR